MAFNNMVRKSMPLCTEQEYPYEEDVKKCKNYSKVCRANVKVTRGVRVGASTELVAQALTLGR